MYESACKYCGLGGSEHARECPKYSAQAKMAAEENLRKTLEGPDSSVPGSEVPSGKFFELGLFGEADIENPAFRTEMKKMGAAENGYLDFDKAVELAKMFQKFDPTNPSKDFLRELRLAVIEKLGLVDDDAIEAVKAYSAVGTPLDIFHGVDAFIVETVDGRDTIVTLDATLNRDKVQRGGKANVIVTKMPAPKED